MQNWKIDAFSNMLNLAFVFKINFRCSSHLEFVLFICMKENVHKNSILHNRFLTKRSIKDFFFTCLHFDRDKFQSQIKEGILMVK